MTTLVAGGHGIIHEDISRVSAELRKDPGNVQKLFARSALYRAHGEADKARADLEQIAGQDSPPAAVFFELADLYFGAGKLEESRKSLEKYFKATSPKHRDFDPASHRLMARVRAGLGERGEAAQEWDLFFEQTHLVAVRDFHEASELAFISNDLERADELLRSGLKRYPKSIELHQTRAKVLIAQNKIAAAEAACGILQKLYPELGFKLAYEEGLMWKSGGFPRKARASFEKAARSYREIPLQLKTRPEVKMLKKNIEKQLQK